MWCGTFKPPLVTPASQIGGWFKTQLLNFWSSSLWTGLEKQLLFLGPCHPRGNPSCNWRLLALALLTLQDHGDLPESESWTSRCKIYHCLSISLSLSLCFTSVRARACVCLCVYKLSEEPIDRQLVECSHWTIRITVIYCWVGILSINQANASLFFSAEEKKIKLHKTT